jgi:hypothetical protein
MRCYTRCYTALLPGNAVQTPTVPPARPRPAHSTTSHPALLTCPQSPKSESGQAIVQACLRTAPRPRDSRPTQARANSRRGR